ncbi:hypothetical protein J6590_059887 [Homalodisca vitripennis]|nr:hypothetical protein J6590_059887 [Homalodisca vitripennis]
MARGVTPNFRHSGRPVTPDHAVSFFPVCESLTPTSTGLKALDQQSAQLLHTTELRTTDASRCNQLRRWINNRLSFYTLPSSELLTLAATIIRGAGSTIDSAFTHHRAQNY